MAAGRFSSAVRVVRRCGRAVPERFAAHFAARLVQSRTGGSCPPANRSSLSFRVGASAASGLMRPPKNGFFMPARTDVRAGMCAYGAKNPASPRAVLPNKRIRREANGRCGRNAGIWEAWAGTSERRRSYRGECGRVFQKTPPLPAAFARSCADGIFEEKVERAPAQDLCAGARHSESAKSVEALK